MTDRNGRDYALWSIAIVLVVIFALIPVLWLISISLKPPADLADQRFIPSSVSFDNYKSLFEGGISDSPFIKPLINSIGIALITTAISIVLASFCAYAADLLRPLLLLRPRARPARFPRHAADPRRRAGARVVPADLHRRAAVRHVAGAAPLRHLAGADHPLPHLLAAAGDLRPRRLLPGDSLGARAGGPGRRGDAVPGLHESDRAAGGAGRLHRRDPRLHLLLERLPLRDLADQLGCLADRSRRARLLHRRIVLHRADRQHRRRGGRGDG